MSEKVIEKKEKISLKQYFKNAYKYRYLMQEIIRKNVKLQYRDSFLGMLWTFLQPLFTMIVLVFIFGNIFGKSNTGVVCYPVYLLTGRLLFEFYTQSTKRAMRSIRNSASVLKKVYVPKYIYPLSNVLSNFVTFAISLTVLIVVMGYFLIKNAMAGGTIYPDLHLSWYIIFSVVPILILCVFCLGVGLILSVLNVFFKDIEYIYDVVCTMLFYATPIMYRLETLKIGAGAVGTILKLNPLYSIIEMFRCCVLYCRMWDWNHFYYAIGASVVVLLIGIWAFYKNQDKFILHI
ncbi:MAG: ABC transporter permease [Clostridia bacterium]|nr:ABC transporter permease [Clostridia bacterium]